jgi:hypothetical protein
VSRLKNLAARRQATLYGFNLVQIQSRVTVELADRIFAALVGTVDGEGDKVLNDQLDVYFGPVGGRPARVDTAASAHPDAQAFT